MTPQIARKEVSWQTPDLTSALASFTDARHKTKRDGARRTLILAAGDWRLEYRVLRCAKACFDEVYVLGTRGAERLKLSLFSSGFVRLSGTFDDLGSLTTIRQINDFCERKAIDYILPGDAETTAFLASYGPFLLVPHYPVPPRDVFDRLNDKWRFSGVCADLKIPHPATQHFASGDEFAAWAAQGHLSYPTVIKPLSMNAGKGVKKLDSISDIPAGIKYAPLIAQAYVPGQDYCAFFLCQNGRISRAVSYVKDKKGITFLNDPKITRQAQTIIEHFHYDGVIGFDIRRQENGDFWFIECNPRFWIRMELALIIGIDFIYPDHAETNDVYANEPLSETIPILSPRNLIKSLIRPWKLSRHEFGVLSYLARDPVVNILSAFSDRAVPAENFFE